MSKGRGLHHLLATSRDAAESTSVLSAHLLLSVPDTQSGTVHLNNGHSQEAWSVLGLGSLLKRKNRTSKMLPKVSSMGLFFNSSNIYQLLS